MVIWIRRHWRLLLMQARANLDGSFELSRLNADISIADQGINDISGQLVYSGGQLRARVERQSIDTELPMLVRTSLWTGLKVTVPVATADGEPLGQLFLQEDGWGGDDSTASCGGYCRSELA